MKSFKSIKITELNSCFVTKVLARTIGRLPENNFEKLQVVHGIGLDKLRFKYG